MLFVVSTQKMVIKSLKNELLHKNKQIVNVMKEIRELKK